MRILVNMMNHNSVGQSSLEDVIGIFGHQCRTLGIEIVWDRANNQWLNGPDDWNLVVEGFTPQFVDQIAWAHGRGARFICLATEEPSDRGFNQGTQREMTARQEMFPNAAPYLSAILHLVPGEYTANWYAQWAPTAYVELGYASSLLRPSAAAQLRGGLVPEPKFDFGFFGTVSKRRLKLLKKLANRTGKRDAIRVVGNFPSQDERDREILNCKVVLQIKKFEEMGLVSSSRCNTALNCGRPVVAEPHLLSKPWDEIVTFAKSEEEFINMALMARATWRGLHAGQYQRFRDRLPPEICVGEPLRKVGILPQLSMKKAA